MIFFLNLFPLLCVQFSSLDPLYKLIPLFCCLVSPFCASLPSRPDLILAPFRFLFPLCLLCFLFLFPFTAFRFPALYYFCLCLHLDTAAHSLRFPFSLSCCFSFCLLSPASCFVTFCFVFWSMFFNSFFFLFLSSQLSLHCLSFLLPAFVSLSVSLFLSSVLCSLTSLYHPLQPSHFQIAFPLPLFIISPFIPLLCPLVPFLHYLAAITAQLPSRYIPTAFLHYSTSPPYHCLSPLSLHFPCSRFHSQLRYNMASLQQRDFVPLT